MTISPFDDADAFLSDFAVTVTIGNKQVKGILDTEGALVNFVDTLTPIFECKTSDIEDWPRGTNLVHGDITYRIVAIPPADGSGFTMITLERQ